MTDRTLTREEADAIWDLTLARLEQDVAHIEQAVADGGSPEPDPWEPPADPGPLPARLRERAERLLERQRVAMDAVSRAASSAVRHQELTGRLHSGRGETAPSVYVDVRA